MKGDLIIMLEAFAYCSYIVRNHDLSLFKSEVS